SFFFQAEDGIRDKLVTGVQTCALPISATKLFPAIRTGALEVARHVDPVSSLASSGAQDLWQEASFIDEDLVARVHDYGGRVIARSEERRVGKSGDHGGRRGRIKKK